MFDKLVLICLAVWAMLANVAPCSSFDDVQDGTLMHSMHLADLLECELLGRMTGTNGFDLFLSKLGEWIFLSFAVGAMSITISLIVATSSPLEIGKRIVDWVLLEMSCSTSLS